MVSSTYVRVRDPNLSRAWLRAIKKLAIPKRREAIPLVVTFSSFADGVPDEVHSIREAINVLLAARGKPSVGTIANTIFPETFWDRTRDDQLEAAENLYARYLGILPRISRYPANRNGIYFARMIAYQPVESPIAPVNQIRHVLTTYRDGNHRRSALQLAIFDPTRDHTDQRQRGFPCLHQIAISPEKDHTLALTAFYGTQYLLTRAYGNYVGLARLGTFLADQLDLQLSRVTCVASVGALGAPKSAVLPLIAQLEHVL